MESCKLEIVLHSGKSLDNVKNFGTMDPYVVVWISGGGKETEPLKTEVAKRGGSFPVWNYSMDFNISSMNNNYTLFCEIKHDGHMVDRKIGQAQIPFKDLLAGDASGENVSYPVKISSGEVKGEIILSHKFSQPEVNEKDSSGKVADRPKKKGGQKKKKKKKNGMMKRIGKSVATQVASKAILLAGTVGLIVALDDEVKEEDQDQNQNQNQNFQLPESPRKPMEFLSRSWSAAALQVSKTLHSPLSPLVPKSGLPPAANDGADMNRFSGVEAADDHGNNLLAGNTFSFASSATSQLVLERIMSQSDISPLASGRLSHSSGPLNATLMEDTDTPPISPSDDYEDVVKYLRANNTLQPLFANARGGYGAGGSSTPAGKTVGRWLKERREKKKEETRAHNAQLHAAVSVAGVAAAVATIAAATAAASASRKDEQMAKTDMAVASAATLVAAQCVEAAEAMGAEREHLIAAVNSAVNVKSHGDILTLTAAAATALRGAATLKARALKEVWNIAAVIPVDRGVKVNKNNGKSSGYREDLLPEENFLGMCNQELLARGSELLKRTRNGDLHWKIVSVYIHRTGEVMLKMKSKHVGSTITKKKKNVVLEVIKNIQAWPGRHLFDGGEQRRYFGLRTSIRGVVEFECRSQREYDMWTQGVSRLLSIVAEKKLARLP